MGTSSIQVGLGGFFTLMVIHQRGLACHSINIVVYYLDNTRGDGRDVYLIEVGCGAF